MYQWFVILSIVSGTILPLLMQTDFWPFSSYSMFSSNLTNTKLKNYGTYQLIGITQNGHQQVISNQNVTGAIHPGMLSVAVSTLALEEKKQCVGDLLTYWTERYKLTSPGSQNLERFALVEINNKNQKKLYLEKNIFNELNKE